MSREERRRPPASSMGSVPTPSCVLSTRCAWCPPDPSTKTASLGSGRHGAGQSPPPRPLDEDEKGKDTKVSSLARISYGAQELAVFLLADSPSDFENHSSKRKQKL